MYYTSRSEDPIRISLKDTPKTERFRNNLRTINECLIKHWAGLRIKDSEVERLAQQILKIEIRADRSLSKNSY